MASYDKAGVHAKIESIASRMYGVSTPSRDWMCDYVDACTAGSARHDKAEQSVRQAGNFQSMLAAKAECGRAYAGACREWADYLARGGPGFTAADKLEPSDLTVLSDMVLMSRFAGGFGKCSREQADRYATELTCSAEDSDFLHDMADGVEKTSRDFEAVLDAETQARAGKKGMYTTVYRLSGMSGKQEFRSEAMTSAYLKSRIMWHEGEAVPEGPVAPGHDPQRPELRHMGTSAIAMDRTCVRVVFSGFQGYDFMNGLSREDYEDLYESSHILPLELDHMTSEAQDKMYKLYKATMTGELGGRLPSGPGVELESKDTFLERCMLRDQPGWPVPSLGTGDYDRVCADAGRWDIHGGPSYMASSDKDLNGGIWPYGGDVIKGLWPANFVTEHDLQSPAEYMDLLESRVRQGTALRADLDMHDAVPNQDRAVSAAMMKANGWLCMGTQCHLKPDDYAPTESDLSAVETRLKSSFDARFDMIMYGVDGQKLDMCLADARAELRRRPGWRDTLDRGRPDERNFDKLDGFIAETSAMLSDEKSAAREGKPVIDVSVRSGDKPAHMGDVRTQAFLNRFVADGVSRGKYMDRMCELFGVDKPVLPSLMLKGPADYGMVKSIVDVASDVPMLQKRGEQDFAFQGVCALDARSVVKFAEKQRGVAGPSKSVRNGLDAKADEIESQGQDGLSGMGFNE